MVILTLSRPHAYPATRPFTGYIFSPLDLNSERKYKRSLNGFNILRFGSRFNKIYSVYSSELTSQKSTRNIDMLISNDQIVYL